jgi:hypothetical protein
MRVTETPKVPELGEILSRDGVRRAVDMVYRHLRQLRLSEDTFRKDVYHQFGQHFSETPVASATTIAPAGMVQQVTGSVTVATISAGPQSDHFVLLAVDGFDLATGGNIAAAKTIGAGKAVELFLNHSDNLWYPTD